MPTNYNRDLFKALINKFNIRDGSFFDNKLPNFITPILDIREKGKVATAITTSVQSTTLLPASNANERYITSLTLSCSKDVSNLSTGLGVYCLIDGVNTFLGQLALLSAKAENLSATYRFPYPIKIDRNSTVVMQMGEVTANFTVSATINYFESETLT